MVLPAGTLIGIDAVAAVALASLSAMTARRLSGPPLIPVTACIAAALYTLVAIESVLAPLSAPALIQHPFLVPFIVVPLIVMDLAARRPVLAAMLTATGLFLCQVSAAPPANASAVASAAVAASCLVGAIVIAKPTKTLGVVLGSYAAVVAVGAFQPVAVVVPVVVVLTTVFAASSGKNGKTTTIIVKAAMARQSETVKEIEEEDEEDGEVQRGSSIAVKEDAMFHVGGDSPPPSPRVHGRSFSLPQSLYSEGYLSEDLSSSSGEDEVDDGYLQEVISATEETLQRIESRSKIIGEPDVKPLGRLVPVGVAFDRQPA
ncbi:Uncharacterized protein PBTT_05851 [Plasmodiophora brassicae]|nr:hypothetical protein PBRA_002294 [Plasmodiophora brassicae]